MKFLWRECFLALVFYGVLTISTSLGRLRLRRPAVPQHCRSILPLHQLSGEPSWTDFLSLLSLWSLFFRYPLRRCYARSGRPHRTRSRTAISRHSKRIEECGSESSGAVYRTGEPELGRYWLDQRCCQIGGSLNVGLSKNASSEAPVLPEPRL